MIAFSIAALLASSASAQNLTFKVPPVKIPFTVKDRQAYITASALISMTSKDGDLDIFNLQLTADLTGLQQNMTALLSSQLDKDDHCGDRIAIQQATLAPADPASIATVQLHYERWACVKAFGKQQAKRVVGGNAVIPVTLTPGVDENKTELRLVPEVGAIEADGSLGELLRSGTVGEMIREKIRSSIVSAMQKGTNLSATLPPAAQGYATIENAEFKDGGSGSLSWTGKFASRKSKCRFCRSRSRNASPRAKTAHASPRCMREETIFRGARRFSPQPNTYCPR